MVKRVGPQVPKLNYGPPFYTYTWQYNSMGNTLYITKYGEKDSKDSEKKKECYYKERK